MGFSRHLWFRKKKAVEEKFEIEEKPEEDEFSGISSDERKKHAGEHIAIVGGKIVASSSAAIAAMMAAKRYHPAEGIDLRYVGSDRLLIKCKCLEEGQ